MGINLLGEPDLTPLELSGNPLATIPNVKKRAAQVKGEFAVDVWETVGGLCT